MKTQSTSSTLPQSNKESFSPMLKQLSIIPQQSGLKLQNNLPENSNKCSIPNSLHYRNNFHDNNMKYWHYKIYFKDSKKVEYEVDVENDYEYSQTYLFVERVIQTLNEKHNLNLPTCASNYQLFFAKKNGSRNSSFPELMNKKDFNQNSNFVKIQINITCNISTDFLFFSSFFISEKFPQKDFDIPNNFVKKSKVIFIGRKQICQFSYDLKNLKFFNSSSFSFLKSEIDLYNTNIQKAMKFHDKNLFRLKKVSRKSSSRGSLSKNENLIDSQNNANDLTISQGKFLQGSKVKSSFRQLDASVLTNITNNNMNEKSLAQQDGIPQNKYSINQGSSDATSTQTGFFSCFRFC